MGNSNHIDDELRDEMQALLPQYALEGLEVWEIPEDLEPEIIRHAKENLGRN